jgi:glutamate-1-semialdehyde 2,1-aminomutase
MGKNGGSPDSGGGQKLGGTSFERGRALGRRAREIIPGGAHTYAKGDDQFPVLAPPFITHGRGCRVWDMDGNQYIEYGMGLRAVTLGHAYEPAYQAAEMQLKWGCNFNRPAPIEVECAEKFLELIPTADMVKFCKDGSTAVDGAIRLARASTGRDLIARCVDHPFFSTSDWFIGTTGMPAGIPQPVRDGSVKFAYNDLPSLEKLFAAYPQKIACVILEAARTAEPAPGFLQGLQALCRQQGTLLIFDEMITGFRWHRSGAQHVYGVTPDLSAFGKALGNGFSVSAIAGRREIMELGGLDHNRERVFLLSTTHGAETHALAAAIAVMNVYQTEPVTEHLHRQGLRLRTGVDQSVARHGLQGYVECLGRDCAVLFATYDKDKKPSQVYRALFMQELIRGGVLAPSFIVSYSHTDLDIDLTIEAVDKALQVYRRAMDEAPEKYLTGRPVKPVFRPFA